MQNLFPIDYPILTRSDIEKEPANLLKYVYYLKDQAHIISFNLISLIENPEQRKKYHNVTIDDFSVLGAAIIAKGMPTEKKLAQIQQLLKLGFKPTQKDRELALFENMQGVLETTNISFKN